MDGPVVEREFLAYKSFGAFLRTRTDVVEIDQLGTGLAKLKCVGHGAHPR